jgi:hypothetical protein
VTAVEWVGAPYGSMNARTTEVSIELRYLMLRNGRLLRRSGVLPSREAMIALQVAARFLGLPSARHGCAYGWLQDMQSTAIAMIEGPS